MKYVYYYDTKFGKMSIIEEDGFVVEIDFNNTKDYHEVETILIKNAYMQINEYLSGKRKEFDLLIKPKGSSFQQKVWNELIKIPYGQIRTYKDIALSINQDKAYRAVGGANNKNPLPIIIPCHRVIGCKNKLTGYALGLEIKEYLLNLEKINNN